MARQFGRWGRIPAQVDQSADSTRISDPPGWMARGRNAAARSLGSLRSRNPTTVADGHGGGTKLQPHYRPWNRGHGPRGPIFSASRQVRGSANSLQQRWDGGTPRPGLSRSRQARRRGKSRTRSRCSDFCEKHLRGIIAKRPPDGWMFDAPRPADPDVDISKVASQWFQRFSRRLNPKLPTFHELRDTWIEEARHCPTVKREIWEIISGHSAATVSDRYGGEKPHVLLNANQDVCKFLIEDPEIRAAILLLVA